MNNLGVLEVHRRRQDLAQPCPRRTATTTGCGSTRTTRDVFIQSNDGGANVTTDGGRTWSTQLNQPTAEIYQVAVDDQFPYRLYGAQQDNTTLIVPSLPADRVSAWTTPMQTWTQGPGCETGPIAPKPRRPRRSSTASCKGEFSPDEHESRARSRRAGSTRRTATATPRATSSIASSACRRSRLSPHDPNVVYYGSQVVHRTRDEGRDVGDDQPRPHGATSPTSRASRASRSPATSPARRSTRPSTPSASRRSRRACSGRGRTTAPCTCRATTARRWKNVTPPDLPPGGRVQNIEVSPHRRGLGLPGRLPLPARRLAALHLPDRRLRRDVDGG